MSISLYDACIKELENENKGIKRNLEPIYNYLKTLHNFVNLTKNHAKNYDEIIQESAKILKLETTKKNQLLIQQGDKGENFFVLLKGKLSVLILKTKDYYLNEEEYLSHLLSLRVNNHIEIISEIIQTNSLIFNLPELNFDILIKTWATNSSKESFYQKFPSLKSKVKEVYDTINTKEFKDAHNIRKTAIIINPKDYAERTRIPKNIEKISDEIKFQVKKQSLQIHSHRGSINSSTQVNNDTTNNKEKIFTHNKEKVSIPSYEIVGELETGCTFGEIALENNNCKRQATIISLDDCKLGYISKKEYDVLIHDSIEKGKKIFFNIIYSYKIFRNISSTTFEKKYFNFFKNKIFLRNHYLLKSDEEINNIYLTINGEFEISCCKNLIEINELIIHHKKYLLENYNSKETSKFANFEEELKENEEYIINKNFRSKEVNKFIFERKKIKIGIYYDKEIIGLCDLLKKEIKQDNKIAYINLMDCMCLSGNCEVFQLPMKEWNYIHQFEDSVSELTKELEFNKIKCIIEILKKQKNFIFDSIKKNEQIKMLEYNSSQLKKNLNFNPYKKNKSLEVKIRTSYFNKNLVNKLNKKFKERTIKKTYKLSMNEDDLKINDSNTNNNNLPEIKKEQIVRATKNDKKTIKFRELYFKLNGINNNEDKNSDPLQNLINSFNKSNDKQSKFFTKNLVRNFLYDKLFYNALNINNKSIFKPCNTVINSKLQDKNKNILNLINIDNKFNSNKNNTPKPKINKKIKIIRNFNEFNNGFNNDKNNKLNQNYSNLYDALIFDNFNNKFNSTFNLNIFKIK